MSVPEFTFRTIDKPNEVQVVIVRVRNGKQDEDVAMFRFTRVLWDTVWGGRRSAGGE